MRGPRCDFFTACSRFSLPGDVKILPFRADFAEGFPVRCFVRVPTAVPVGRSTESALADRLIEVAQQTVSRAESQVAGVSKSSERAILEDFCKGTPQKWDEAETNYAIRGMDLGD